MKLNDFRKGLLAAGRWMVTTLFCLSAIALLWQGMFISTRTAAASPLTTVIAAADVGSQVQGKASEDAGRAKSFIRDTANRVERTANRNADRVEDATDSQGNFLERRAQRDANRIEKRAEEDANRTQKAVDNTKNFVEQAVDNIKDAFGS